VERVGRRFDHRHDTNEGAAFDAGALTEMQAAASTPPLLPAPATPTVAIRATGPGDEGRHAQAGVVDVLVVAAAGGRRWR